MIIDVRSAPNDPFMCVQQAPAARLPRALPFPRPYIGPRSQEEVNKLAWSRCGVPPIAAAHDDSRNASSRCKRGWPTSKQKSCRRLGTKPPPSYSRHKARDRTVGPGEVRRSMGMRRLPISLDPMKFLQAFAAGLRAEFADAACAPVPDYLAALMRQLDGDRDGDRNEHSGEGREYGTGSTESASGVDCRGRRRTARVRGEAA